MIVLKLMYVYNSSTLALRRALQLSVLRKFKWSGSNKNDTFSPQGKLLEIFVVLDICVDCFADQFCSFNPILFNPFAVLFFLALLFLLLLVIPISVLMSVNGDEGEGWDFSTWGKL